MGLIKRYIVSFTIIILLNPLNAVAAWQGLEQIVSGSWGSAENQFGIKHQDTSDWFPRFTLTSQGKIVVRDGINHRLKIYLPTGGLEQIVPYPPNRHYTELTLADTYGFSGEFVGFGADGTSDFYFRADQKKYIRFSSTGDLLQTYTERPPELGKVKQKRLGSDQYEVIVTYPDKEWKILCEGVCSRYVRDTSNNLYCWYERSVRRYNDAGEEIAKISMPEDNIERIPLGREMGMEDTLIIHEEYGEPVIGPNGDVYTWKRTPDNYSIIKWTWQ